MTTKYSLNTLFNKIGKVITIFNYIIVIKTFTIRIVEILLRIIPNVNYVLKNIFNNSWFSQQQNCQTYFPLLNKITKTGEGMPALHKYWL